MNFNDLHASLLLVGGNSRFSVPVCVRHKFAHKYLRKRKQVAQVAAYILRRNLAQGHLVVETNGKPCDVRQEEEYCDEGIKMNLSYFDHGGGAVR